MADEPVVDPESLANRFFQQGLHADRVFATLLQEQHARTWELLKNHHDMLKLLETQVGVSPLDIIRQRMLVPYPSDRKLKFWCAAVACRVVTEVMAPVEQNIPNLLGWQKWAESEDHSSKHFAPYAAPYATFDVTQAVRHWSSYWDESPYSERTQPIKADLLREILGNPFINPPTLRWDQAEMVEEGQQVNATIPCRVPWLTPLVEGLALQTYNTPVQGWGKLCKDRLAVLADAMEEAHCDEWHLLEHLRSSGPHFKGCWVIDLVLGLN